MQNTMYTIGQGRQKLRGVAYTVSKLRELWPTKGLKGNRHFYPPYT